ncbi:MAG: sulfotransferase family 2 domain-containing protein [Planctomycetota bacterium]
MYNHDYKIAYVHIPKTGGSTVKQVLNCMENPNHRPLGDLPNDYFAFTLIRNPWDRLVSAYHYFDQYENIKIPHMVQARDAIKKCGSFSNMLSALPRLRMELAFPHLHQQSYWLDSRLWVGKFENMEQSLEYVSSVTNCPLSKIVHLNRTQRQPYHKYYDTRLLDLFNIYFSDDVTLGYKYE